MWRRIKFIAGIQGNREHFLEMASSFSVKEELRLYSEKESIGWRWKREKQQTREMQKVCRVMWKRQLG